MFAGHGSPPPSSSLRGTVGTAWRPTHFPSLLVGLLRPDVDQYECVVTVRQALQQSARSLPIVAHMITEHLAPSSLRVATDIRTFAPQRPSEAVAVNGNTRGPVRFRTGPLACCALGRIRTCNLLIRSQMLYPLSYERLAFRRFFLPVGVAGTTLHDLRRQAKSIPLTPSDLRKCVCGRAWG